jgi:hypothetical protein
MNALDRIIAAIDERADRHEARATNEAFEEHHRLTSMVVELRWASAMIQEEMEKARRTVRHP